MLKTKRASLNIQSCFSTAALLLVGILFNRPLAAQKTVPQENYSDYVEPLAGTAPATTAAAKLHSEAGSEKNGNTIPAVGLPFGMTQFTAQTTTSEQKCQSPYVYNDRLFKGFRASHWLSGSCTQDYGSTSVIAITGSLSDTNSLKLDHDQELSRPYLYSIAFPGKYSVKLTGSLRSGIWEFTMLKTDSLFIVIRPNSDFNQGKIERNSKLVSKEAVVYGYNPVHRIYQGWGAYAGFNGYFYLQASSAKDTMNLDASAKQKDKKLADEKDPVWSDNQGASVVLRYYLQKGEKLLVKMGTSFSSVLDARLNLEGEIPDWNFTRKAQENKQIWDEALGKVKVFTPDIREKRIFYTSLYHAFQQPRLFTDISGHYPAFDGGTKPLIETAKQGNYYDDFSMWDIYRAQLPLLMIINPTLVNDLVGSLMLKSKEGGWLPIFPCWNSYTAAMIGDHGTAFIAAAYQRGIRNYNLSEIYPYMRRNAFDSSDTAAYAKGKGRRALKSYLQYGYIPMEDKIPDAFHKQEQVSRTLEYAYDDYALSILARALGRKDDYKTLHERAFNYQHVFDSAVGMVRGKFVSGRWSTPFEPYKRAAYITEGTPAQYTFYVPQDIRGLARLMGGTVKFERQLDQLFKRNGYWHGNEPGHQIPFLYNYTAAPYKTQMEVRRILASAYGDGPGGLDGNDDAGQMSAWYVFAALGFYPVDPVSGQYILCSPLFDRSVINLGNGKEVRIITHKSSESALYISRVALDGQTYPLNYLKADLFIRGGRLDIWLAQSPTKWGNTPPARPSSLSDSAASK